MANVAATPGWYPDAHVPAQLRWFDGSAWTPHVHPMSPAAGPHAGWPPPYAHPAGHNENLKWVLPVNRSGWAIAAGYAGLFSILLIFAPIALLLGIVALFDLQRRPQVGGVGRAWFAVGTGLCGTLVLIAVLGNAHS